MTKIGNIKLLNAEEYPISCDISQWFTFESLGME